MESILSTTKAYDWEISGTPITKVQKPNNHTKEGTFILNGVKEATSQIIYKV
jgi:hypothetical protein